MPTEGEALMKRFAGALLLAALGGGCVAPGGGGGGSPSGPSMAYGAVKPPPSVPGVVGPRGAPVPMAAPYSAAPPAFNVAQAMIEHSVPLNMVQTGGSGIQQA